MESLDEYLEKSIYYATHSSTLVALKQKLVKKRRTTPLFNTAHTVAYIEQAYQHMWQRHLQGLPPDTFDVREMNLH